MLGPTSIYNTPCKGLYATSLILMTKLELLGFSFLCSLLWYTAVLLYLNYSSQYYVPMRKIMPCFLTSWYDCYITKVCITIILQKHRDHLVNKSVDNDFY